MSEWVWSSSEPERSPGSEKLFETGVKYGKKIYCGCCGKEIALGQKIYSRSEYYFVTPYCSEFCMQAGRLRGIGL